MSYQCPTCGQVASCWTPRPIRIDPSVAALNQALQESLSREAAATLREQRLREALRELVACKDLKEQAAAMNSMARGRPGKIRADLLRDYQRRKPLAWAAARAALQEAAGSETS